jgi:hypothetical protein
LFSIIASAFFGSSAVERPEAPEVPEVPEVKAATAARDTKTAIEICRIRMICLI